MTAEQIKENLSKKNFKTYSFFLVFTAFLWFALQFSKNYSKEIDFTIEYTKVGADRFVKENSDKEVSLTLEGNGFQLLKFFIFNKTLKLDVRKASAKLPTKSYYTGRKMLEVIKSSLNYTGVVTFSSKDTITVRFSKIITKEIPIKVKDNIDFASGFTSLTGITTSKNTVAVRGPEVILDTLKYIETQELQLKDLQKNYEGKIALDVESLSADLKIKEKKIPFSIEIDKLTEGEFTIPIDILNVPKGKRVQLFPKEVTVIFGVALKNYPKLTADDFSVVVDMNKAASEGNTLALKLEKSSKMANNVRLTEKEVQFIVIK